MRLPDPARTRAVLIGVGDYHDPSMENFPAVANNLADLYSLLIDPEIWGLPPENCVVLLDPQDRDSVMLAVQAAAKDATDTLLFYYVGHGDVHRSRLMLALPTTTRGNSRFIGIEYDVVQQVANEARRIDVIVILDCCFSGIAVGQQSATATLVERLTNDSSVFTLTSTSDLTVSLAPPGARNTAFTGELVRVLGGGVAVAEEYLSLKMISEELARALSEKGMPVPRFGHSGGYAELAIARNKLRPRADAVTTVIEPQSLREAADIAYRLEAQLATFGPLLRALALARGQGMPQHGEVWASAASGLHGSRIRDPHIDALLVAAEPHLVQDEEFGVPVYRIRYAALRDHYLGSSELRHERIAAALIDLARTGRRSGYVTHHLVGHVSAAGLPAWLLLADNEDVLDRIDEAGLAESAWRAAVSGTRLPATIAGVVSAPARSRPNRPLVRTVARQLATAIHAHTTTFRAGATGQAQVRTAVLKHKPLRFDLRIQHGDMWSMCAVADMEGAIIVVGDDQGGLTRWDVERGTRIGESIAGHTRGIHGLCALAGTHFVSTGFEGVAQRWDARTGRRVGEPMRHRLEALAAVPVDGARLLVVLFGDSTLQVWDLEKETHLGGGPAKKVDHICVLPVPGGDLVAAGRSDGAIRIWDPRSMSYDGKEMIGHNDEISALCTLREATGRLVLVSAAQDLTIRFWDIERKKALGSPVHVQYLVESLAAVPGPEGHDLLAVGTWNGDVVFLDPDSRAETGRIPHAHDSVEELVSVPATVPMIATRDDDQTVTLWLRPVERPTPPITGSIRSLCSLRHIDDTSLVVTGTSDGATTVWDPESGQSMGRTVRWDLSGRARIMRAVPNQENHPLVAVGYYDGGVAITWNLATGEPVSGAMEVPGEPTLWTMVAFTNPKGEPRLAIGCSDGKIVLWDPITGKKIGKPIAAHKDSVFGMCGWERPAGRTLLFSGSTENVLKGWDPETGKLVLKEEVGPNISALECFTDRNGEPLIAVVRDERKITIWDPHAGLPLAGPYKAKVGEICAVQTRHGPMLACLDNARIDLLDPMTGERIGDPIPVLDSVTAIAAVGSKLAVGCSEGFVLLDLPTR